MKTNKRFVGLLMAVLLFLNNFVYVDFSNNAIMPKSDLEVLALGDWINDMNKTRSEEYIEYPNKERYRYWYHDSNKGDKIFLYDTNNKEQVTADLGEPFGTRIFQYGQLKYVPIVDNEGIPNNEDVYKNSSRSEVYSAIKNIAGNYSKAVGSSYLGYENTSSQRPQKYFWYPEADNYSYKSWTSGYMMLTDEVPNENKQYFYNPDATDHPATAWDERYGNPRYIYTRNYDRVSSYGFMADLLGKSSIDDGWDLREKNVRTYPWTRNSNVPYGFYNLQFSDFSTRNGISINLNNGNVSSSKMLQAVQKLIDNGNGNNYPDGKVPDDKLEESNLILFLSYQNSVHKATDPMYKETIEKLTKVQFGSSYVAENHTVGYKDDLGEQMEVVALLKYFSISDFGGHSYSNIMGCHGSTGGWYFSLGIPKLYGSFDLHFGSWYNRDLGEVEYAGNEDTYAYRVREYNVETGEKGRILNWQVDKLKRGQTYVAESFLVMERLEEDERTESYHSHFKIDNYISVNDNFTITDEMGDDLARIEKMSGFKIAYDESKGTAELTDTPHKDTIMPYNDKSYKNEINVHEEAVVGYERVFTVPSVDGAGNPATSIQIYSHISDEDRRYRGNGSDYKQDDNLKVSNEESSIFFYIGESSEDFLVAHAQNPVNPSIIEELSLGEVVITEYNGQPYTNQELKPTDKVTFEIYLQRDKESTLEGVAFKDLSMWLEEYPNPDLDLSRYINSDPLYTTSFNNGDKFTTNAPKITGFKRFDSLINQHDADWTTYSSSSHQNEFVDAGDVVKFELKDYVIPSKDTIINDTNKWSVNHPAIASLSNIEHLSVQFELNVNADKVNPNTGNDWARLNLKVGKPNKRNMYIEEVAVYDEDGRHIQTFKTEGRTNTSFFISNPLEGGKNYYAVPKVKFEYPYDTKRSNTTNLELHSVPTYNNYPEADMANTKFRVYSDKTSYWNDGDVGIYDPTNRSGFNIKTYNPDADTMNGLVVASKAKPDTKEFNLWIKIPDAETANGNNLIPDVADQVTIHGTIGSNGKNNEVKDIQLFSTSGAEFATKGSDGSDYQLLYPNKSYYSLITVRRAEGSEDSMIDLNPKLKVSYSLANDAQSFEATLSPYTGSQLKNVGDEIVYRLNNLYSPTDYIRIEAVLDVPDTKPSDNTREEIWSNIYNFHVRDLTVTPDKIPMGKTEYSKTVSHSVQFFAGFNTNGASTTLTNVPIIVEEYQRPKNGNWSFVRRVYQEYHSMTNGVEKQVNFQIDNVHYSQFMDKKYVVKINGGETGNQVYNSEKIRSDNETHVYTASYAREEITFSCNNIRSSNSWSTYYQRWDYTGGVVRRGNGPKGPYTYCSPSARLNYKETTKSHYEKLYIKAWFKSTYVKNYIDIMKYPEKANVRAGEKFDLYIQLVYETNRDKMPWKITRSRCNPDWRSPNYSNTSSRPMLHGIFKISGNQQEVYHQYPNSGGGWGTRTFTYNIMKTRHVPSDTQNLNMRFNLEFDEYYGYYPDLNHPKIPLKICPSFTIKVLGGNPVETGTQSIE